MQRIKEILRSLYEDFKQKFSGSLLAFFSMFYYSSTCLMMANALKYGRISDRRG